MNYILYDQWEGCNAKNTTIHFTLLPTVCVSQAWTNRLKVLYEIKVQRVGGEKQKTKYNNSKNLTCPTFPALNIHKLKLVLSGIKYSHQFLFCSNQNSIYESPGKACKPSFIRWNNLVWSNIFIKSSINQISLFLH